MRASMVIKVAIERPFDEVYELLADPLYFGKWAVTPDTEMEALDNGDWLVELPRGQSLIRFTPPNAYGVLDYEVFPLGESHGSVNPVRLVRIHAIGFPEGPNMPPFTNVKFSALMRLMCEQNNGTFVGITG